MAKARWAWTRKRMNFNDPKLGWLDIPLYTKCRLIKPDARQVDYIKRQQAQTKRRWMVVKLEGMARYVEKDDLMFEEEFDARRLRLKQEGILPKE